MSIWRKLFSRDAAAPADVDRWVVVDTETTGLDAARDTLIAIGGVAVDAEGVVPGDSFEVVLCNVEGSDHDNILVHGIGRHAQRTGVPPAEGLAAFAQWVGDAQYAGYHTDFDRAVLVRAAALAKVLLPERPWLDLAPLAAALAPDKQTKGGGSLDDWLVAFGIECPVRHNAAADALATAELLLHIRARAAKQGRTDFAALLKVAKQQKWLAAGH
jgi:DNA polymerase-3 subunit epsilon